MQRLQRFRVRCSVPGPLLLAALQLCSACADEDHVAFLFPPEAPAPEPGDGVEPAADLVEAPGIATEDTPQTDRLGQAVVAILGTQCVSCHGQSAAQGGLGDLRDLQSLIAQGTIVPGAGASSPLVLRMSDGSMPPDAGDYPKVQPPTSGEIALVRRFIDQLPVAPAPDCGALPFQSLDDVYAALLADVLRTPERDRPFLRYAGLTPASNAGVCGVALERQRAALLGLVNGISTAPDIRAPRAVDSDGVFYRIDLRDYRWNRAIDLQGDGSIEFADGWLALVAAAAPYGLELEGPEADALKQATNTAVPFLPAHALVHAASAGDLYYALVDAQGSVDEHQIALGIDTVADLANAKVKQAGAVVGRPTASREFRVTRFEQPLHPGRYYWLEDEDDNRFNSSSIFEDPIDINGGRWKAVFNLPNGMQAFEVTDRSSERSALPPRDCSREDCTQPAVPNAAACHACHAAGLLPVKDAVRPWVEENWTLFDRDTFAAIQRYYPLAEEFNQLLQNDSQPHLDAAARAVAAVSGPEPISFVYLQFELDPLPLRRVAAELGVPPAALTATLDGLDPRLSMLQAAEGTIDRSTLNATYVTSMCTLHAGSKNRPIACLAP